jgi:ferredoxin-type protein NapG
MAGDDDRMDRRRFFREGLGKLLGQVQKAAEPMARFAKEMEKLESGNASAASRPAGSANAPKDQPGSGTPLPPYAAAARAVTLPLVLRPPGAIDEPGFSSTCTRCGLCVEACPVSAIKIDKAADLSAPTRVPHIIAEDKPCIVCDELACMNACPSGALTLVPRSDIDMGIAIWGQGKCVRPDGDDCRRCVDACPLGTAAIDIDGPEGIEVKAACVGCGSCQNVCPTTPRAIVVVPRKSAASKA